MTVVILTLRETRTNKLTNWSVVLSNVKDNFCFINNPRYTLCMVRYLVLPLVSLSYLQDTKIPLYPTILTSAFWYRTCGNDIQNAFFLVLPYLHWAGLGDYENVRVLVLLNLKSNDIWVIKYKTTYTGLVKSSRTPLHHNKQLCTITPPTWHTIRI